MKRRKFTVGMLVLLLMVLSIPLAASSAPDDTIPLSPTDDYTMNTANNVPGGANGANLGVIGQVVTACSATQESFLKFNLTSATTPITAAELRLRSNFSSATGTLTMGLFTSSNESWAQDAGFTWAARPTRVEGTALATATKTAAGSDVVFSSDALRAALETQRTTGADPKLVTLVVTVIDCTGTTTQAMDSINKSGGVPAVLTLTTQPTAVTMSTFQAADPAVNWPLIAGLGALVALAAGGILFYRKRATTH